MHSYQMASYGMVAHTGEQLQRALILVYIRQKTPVM